MTTRNGDACAAWRMVRADPWRFEWIEIGHWLAEEIVPATRAAQMTTKVGARDVLRARRGGRDGRGGAGRRGAWSSRRCWERSWLCSALGREGIASAEAPYPTRALGAMATTPNTGCYRRRERTGLGRAKIVLHLLPMAYAVWWERSISPKRLLGHAPSE